jgi:hypothetical protein
LEEKINSANRPGTASTFTPRLGRKKECNTSVDVTNSRIDVFIGRIKVLLASRL